MTLDDAMAVGVEELAEFFYLLLKLAALVGVADTDATPHHLHNLRTALDVGTFGNGILSAGEWLVLDELEASAVIDQRIACDARSVVISLGKAAVDDHQHAVGLDGVLALAGMNGDVSVDDVAVLSLHAEAVKDAGADGWVFAQLVVGSLLLVVCGRVGEEIAFESRHAALVEERAVGTTPEVPEVVASLEALFAGRVVLEGRAHANADVMHQIASLIACAVEHYLPQTAVGIEGDGGMVEQVAVADGVHGAMTEEATDVLLQLLGDAEGVVQALHQVFLLGCQLVGMLGVNGGEKGVEHRVVLSVEAIGASLEVDVLERTSAVDVPFGVLLDELPFQFELYDRNGLVHLCDEAHLLFVGLAIVRCSKRQETLAGVIGVCLHREGGKREEVDAVAFLQSSHVGEAQRESQHDGDTGVASRCCTHPQRIVVAPLDVEVVARQQVVHDDVGTRSAVKDVTKDVKLVDAQFMDDIAYRDNEVSRLSRLYDGLDDSLYVGILVFVVGAFVQQFLDDIGKLLRQGLADLASGVFAADRAADLYELQQGAGIVVREVFFGVLLNHLQAFLGVVDEGAEVAHFVFGHGVPEEVAHLALDVSAGVAQDMQEGLVLAVYVGHEMFRAFRQAEDSLQIDDFGAGTLAIGKRLREKLQQTHVDVVVHNWVNGL